MQISVTRAFTNAYELSKRYLFQPFDIGRWFVVGFAAWLAFLGESGSSYSYRSSDRENVSEFLTLIQEFIQSDYFEPAMVVLCVFFVFLSTLILWLNSRGMFIFLHNIINNKSEIKIPWREYKAEANSILRWKLLLFLIGILIFFPLMACSAIWIINLLWPDFTFLTETIPTTIFEFATRFGSIALTLGLLLGTGVTIISSILNLFLIPIMYKERLMATQAWPVVTELFKTDFKAFVRYYLMLLLIKIMLDIIKIIAYIGTCCILALLDLLPYLGAVVFLPFQVFKQYYTLDFMKQFGPEFDLLKNFSNISPNTAGPAPEYFPGTRQKSTKSEDSNPYRP